MSIERNEFINEFDSLSPEIQREVVDFVHFLKIKYSQIDETAYLLSNPANKKHLLKVIKDAENPENLIAVDLNDLQKLEFPE